MSEKEFNIRKSLKELYKEIYADLRRSIVLRILFWGVFAGVVIGSGFLLENAGYEMASYLVKMVGTFNISGSFLNLHKLFLVNKEMHEKIESATQKLMAVEDDEVIEESVSNTTEYAYDMNPPAYTKHEFIRRAEELENYINDFKYAGYNDDLLTLYSLIGSFEAGILSGDISVAACYEQLNAFEREVINKAASSQLGEGKPRARHKKVQKT